MATTKDIRKRIGAVEKTQKIVSAMKMVAAAKLARAQAAIVAARPYADKLAEVLASVSSGVEADAHPLFEVREKVRVVDLVVLTSDRGLCGPFNANVIKRALGVIRERRDELDSISVIAIGRRGHASFAKTGLPMPRGWAEFPAATPELATEVADYLSGRFRSGDADETLLVFGEFVTALTQRPVLQTLLPVRPPSGQEAGAVYKIEPDPVSLLAQLVPRAVEFAIFRALLDSQASEHGARMTAMEAASSNTEELIRTLTLDYNKARQASITAEPRSPTLLPSTWTVPPVPPSVTSETSIVPEPDTIAAPEPWRTTSPPATLMSPLLTTVPPAPPRVTVPSPFSVTEPASVRPAVLTTERRGSVRASALNVTAPFEEPPIEALIRPLVPSWRVTSVAPRSDTEPPGAELTLPALSTTGATRTT